MKGRNNFALETILLSLLFALCIFGAGVGTSQAQQNSVVSGTVTDQGGAVVPGAHVILKQNGTGFITEQDTNNSGSYDFPGLNIGSYDLTVTAKGFKTAVQKGLGVNVSQTLNSDVTLSIGNVTETVEVTASALSVQTDSNVLSTLISAQEISEIATENRNFAALVALGLGVSSTLPDNNTPTSIGSSANISVNGLRQSHNIWLIDGGEADDRGGAGGIDIMPSQ